MSTANPRPALSTELGTDVHDRDLDAPRLRRVRRRRGLAREQTYQRLIANPFLAMLALIAWYVGCREVLSWHRLDLFLLALSCLFLIPLLLQYHCLDCGATGRLTRWRRHECARVRERRNAGKPRRFQGPSPVKQSVIWFFLVLGVAIVGYISTF
ncbi:MAG: hypothetical protein NVSMB9_31660 [Isosphaeraceae bacterium]